MKNLAKFSFLSPKLYFLYINVFILSGIVRLAILLIPFKFLSRFFEKSRKESSYPCAQSRRDVDLIKKIGLAVTRVSKYTPWRCMCYEQGLIAKTILQLNGLESTLIFGVAKNNQAEIQAHAWLQCGSLIVVGGERIEKFGIIASFI